MERVNQEDLDDTYTYVARPDTWYRAGSLVILLANCGPVGIFEGFIELHPDHPHPASKDLLPGQTVTHYSPKDL